MSVTWRYTLSIGTNGITPISTLAETNKINGTAHVKKSVRAHAAEVIDALQNQQSNLDVLIRKHSRTFAESDKKFLQSICYGMCREWFHLQEIESSLLDKPLKARDQILSSIIRCGIYELGWMGSKEHAVVSEYVDVTVTEERPWARGLVNAVLRQFLRKKSELKMERHSAQTLWNHPQWLRGRVYWGNVGLAQCLLCLWGSGCDSWYRNDFQAEGCS